MAQRKKPRTHKWIKSEKGCAANTCDNGSEFEDVFLQQTSTNVINVTGQGGGNDVGYAQQPRNSYNRNGNQQRGGNASNEEMKNTLKECIEKYMASGVIDDVLDCNITDTKIWKFALIDMLTSYKIPKVRFVFDCVLECFENQIFEESTFRDDVVKYLAIQVDDNAVDCPSIYRYVGRLLAGITCNRHMKPTVFTYFFKRYKEYSELKKKSQKLFMSDLFDAALDEAKRLGAERSFVNKLERCGPFGGKKR